MMISVCMATYNGEKYIVEQIESILCQLGKDDEIVVSDDGSRDQTIDLLKAFNDDRIKIYNNTGRHGVVPNFENAIRNANGDTIFLSDQDDIWRRDKIEISMKGLSKSDFIVHNAEIVDSNGRKMGQSFFATRSTKLGYWHNLYKMTYLGCCMAFKQKCLQDILPFPKDILWHDMWIAAVLNKKYCGTLVNECLLFYRRHGNNASPSTEKSSFSKLFQLKYRMIIFIHSMFR